MDRCSQSARGSVWPAAAVVTLSILLSASALAAGGEVTDADVEAIRKDIFREASDGTPGITEADVTPALLKALYGRPNAAAALQRILLSTSYTAINQKLGRMRSEANLRIWAQVAAETGVRIELNNAGKANGAVSDLDLTLFVEAQVLPHHPDVAPGQIYEFLLKRHAELWKAAHGSDAEAFDMAHFKGDVFMHDWRMSRKRWTEFTADLDQTIAKLSETGGTYVVPGGYKPQVYGRYLSDEGRTIVIEPVIDVAATDSIKLEGAPPGVRISPEQRTRHASRLYANVPFGVDRTGALESVLHNYQFGAGVPGLIKHAKYNVRWNDTGLVDLTNLEVDFRRLVVEGRTGAMRQMLTKLFGEFEKSGSLPADFKSLADVQQTLEALVRIELDKVIQQGYAGKERPKNWSPDWQSHQPPENLDSIEAKRAYFKAECDALRRASPAALAIADDQLVEMGETAFREKVRALARLSAAVAAKSVFNQVFTREGFARLRMLHGDDAARRLLAERVRGLHAALAFQSDERMIRSVLDAAPPETHDVIKNIADIAQGQRRAVLEREDSFKKLTVEQLRESDAPLRELMVRLGVGTGDVPSGPGLTRLRAGTLSDADARLGINKIMHEALLEGARRGERALRATDDQIGAFFMQHLGPERPGLIRGTLQNFCDVSTVAAAGDVVTAYVTGDAEGATHAAYDAVLSNVPLGGQFFTMAKSLKSAREGEWGPSVLFIAQHAAGYLGHGTPFAYVLAGYGLTQNLIRLDWHFRGAPTQSEAVSVVLMGDFVMAQAAADRGQFPAPQAELELVRKNAILLNKIQLPNLPPEFKQALIRAHFLIAANQRATAAGRSAPGKWSAWEEDRDNALKEVYGDSDYWLRRLFFYYQVSKDPQTDATREELRRYFGHWVSDYERAFPANGETMSNLAMKAPGWRDAVVEELLNIFIEGRDLDLKARAARQQPETMGYLSKVQTGMDEIAKRVLDEQGRRALGLHKQFEELLWHPKVEQDFVASFLRAASRQPDYKPQPPSLVINIPRPVMARGQALRFDITLAGDIGVLPDTAEDIELQALSFDKIAHHQGRRPSEVLRDDVRTLLGADVPDDKIEVTEFKANFTVASKSNPALKLTDSRTVFAIGRLGEKTPAADPAQKAAEDGAIAVIDQLRTAVDQAGAAAAEAEALCQQARQKASEAETRLAEAARAAAGIESEINKSREVIENLAKQVGGMEASVQQETDAATALGITRDECGVKAQETCELTSRLQNATTEAERAVLYDQAMAAAREVSRLVSAGRKEFTEVKVAAGEVAAIHHQIEPAIPEIDQLKARLDAVSSMIAEAEASIGEARRLAEASLAKSTEVEAQRLAAERLIEEGTRLIEPIKETPRGIELAREMATLNARIAELKQNMGTCAAATLARLEKLTAELNALRDKVTAMAAALEKLLGTFKPGDLRRRSDDALAKSEATLVVAEGYWESIQLMVGHARTCAAVAIAVFKTPMMVLVPGVVGLSIAAAEAQLTVAGFKSARVGGDPAPTEALSYTVKEQNPLAGVKRPPGTPIRLVIFGQHNPPRMVPSVVGLPLKTAEDAIVGAGLKPARAGGDPAPSAERSFTVQAQTPKAGTPVESGASVTLVIFGKYSPPPIVPNVLGMPVASAEGLITAAGLSPSRAAGEPAPRAELSLTVQSQAPAAGTVATPGASVTLLVYGAYKPPPPPAPTPPPPAPTPPPPPVPPPPSPAATEFHVAFDLCFPNGDKLGGRIATLKQQKTPAADIAAEVRRIAVDQVSFEPMQGSQLFISVSDAALQVYSGSAFQPGSHHALQLTGTYRRTKTETGEARTFPIAGALLLQTVAVFDSFADMKARYPKIQQWDPSNTSSNQSISIPFRTADGKFQATQRTADVDASFVFGPLVDGWSREMKQANIEFIASFIPMMDFCFVATAVYGDPQAPQLTAFRRFRDEVLLRHDGGQRFVRWYYQYGPSLAAKVRAHPEAIPPLRAAFDAMSHWLEHANWDDARTRGDLEALAQMLGTLVPPNHSFNHAAAPLPDFPRLFPFTTNSPSTHRHPPP